MQFYYSALPNGCIFKNVNSAPLAHHTRPTFEFVAYISHALYNDYDQVWYSRKGAEQFEEHLQQDNRVSVVSCPRSRQKTEKTETEMF